MGAFLIYNRGVRFPGSSMVEQEAVNFEVAGSSPVPGAILDESPFFLWIILGILRNSGWLKK